MTSETPGGTPDPYGQQPPQPGQQPQQPYGAPPPYGQQPQQPYGAPPPYGQQPQQYGGYAGGPMPPAGSPYGYPQSPVPGGRLAGMGARFGGLVIDSLIVAIPASIIGALTGAYHSSRTCDSLGNCTNKFQFSGTWIVEVVALVLGLAYSAYFVGTRAQTLGHRVAGIRVVDVNTGGLIGPGRGALRWLVMSLTGAICTLGYWSPFFDSQRRQGWHDKASNAVAIPAK